MRRQPARLDAAAPAEWTGRDIDRSRPLNFRLNGLEIEGFAGDTVLSALRAHGIHAVGHHAGHPLALDARTAPLVLLARSADRPELAVEMHACPAVDGMDMVTVPSPRSAPDAPLTRLRAAVAGHAGSLDIAQRGPADRPWSHARAARSQTVDMVVIGGGVSGLSAALEAARRGLTVALLERDTRPGGVSEFFGRTEGEPVAATLLAHLVSEVESHDAITLATGAEAYDFGNGRVQVHRVWVEGNVPRSERWALSARWVVIATGALERLPIFSGNRLPGVCGALDAWSAAHRFGVWAGATVLINTGTNVGYRMAMLAADSGSAIQAVADPRPDPRSRFIEFGKAYGFRFSRGTSIVSARLDNARTPRLAIVQRDAASGRAEAGHLMAERLVVNAGWQPDLTLWIRAGGGVAWSRRSHWLVAQEGPADIALAGSAAGIRGLSACLASGIAAVSRLVDGDAEPVPDPQIEEIYESADGADGAIAISPPEDAKAAPAYYSGAASLAAWPAPPPAGWRSWIPARSGMAGDGASLSLADVVARVQAGEVDAAAAPVLARERCITGYALSAPSRTATLAAEESNDSPPWPRYLDGRFAERQQVWALTPTDGRTPETGCLLYANTRDKDPQLAIGVVVGTADGVSRVVVAEGRHADGETVIIRNGGEVTPARLETLQQRSEGA